ncbi:hypothetical protein ABPG77_003455 [Micractinium sp. CCAP 211/92]
MSARGSLPACPLCTEGLGTYGGPTTLPCGHNLCVHCCAYLAQRQAACPLCRAPFSPGGPLAVNCELRELLRLAQALTAVDAEGEDGWQAVTSAGGGKGGSGPASPRQHHGVRSVGVGDVLDGSGSVMELDPQPWEPDSSSAACRAPGCGKPFSFLLRPRHHCRCCGQLFCGTCTAERMLLPPRFRLPEPQRVCRRCCELLLPIQPLLAGSIAPAVKQPVHDVSDWSALRSLLNPPLSSRLDTDLYTATNILRQYVRAVGTLPRERAIPPAILRGCTGLAVLSVARAAAGWSVSVGSGLVVARQPGGGWSAPSAILSLASSVGWQLGVEVQDVVLVLRSHAALKAFCGAQLGIGGSLSVAAGPVGRAAGARALAAPGAGAVVYSYCAARGAYAGLALEAALVCCRDAVNQAFYGRKVSARQLLLGGAVPPPPAAAALYAALDALMEHAGETGNPRADSFNQLHGQQPAVSGTAVYPAGGYGASGGCGQAELHASGSSSDDEWEPEEEPAVSAPPAPAPHASFFGGLGGGFAAAAPREQLAPYPPVPQVAGARSLYPSLEEEALPYGSLFD